ncbi:unnamed protein product [Lampetra planeri]
MEPFVKFTAQSPAKEKIYRTAQYTCTLLHHLAGTAGLSGDVAALLKQLETHLSMGRKMLRLGQSADCVVAARRTVHLSDPVLRLCLTVAQLNRGLYLACDNLLWAGKLGLIAKLDSDKWSKRAFRFYLLVLLMGLARDAYEVALLVDREARARGKRGGRSGGAVAEWANGEEYSQGSGDPARLGTRVRGYCALTCHVMRTNHAVLLDLVKNLCDVVIPLDRLGLRQSSPGVVGLCGVISSVLGILQITHPWLKLKP